MVARLLLIILSIINILLVNCLHDFFAVVKVWVVHTGVLHLEVQHRDVDPVLGLVVPVAGPAGEVASVLGVPVQESSVLQPGDGGPQSAVDVAGDPHGGVEGEPGGVERDPR